MLKPTLRVCVCVCLPFLLLVSPYRHPVFYVIQGSDPMCSIQPGVTSFLKVYNMGGCDTRGMRALVKREDG